MFIYRAQFPVRSVFTDTEVVRSVQASYSKIKKITETESHTDCCVVFQTLLSGGDLVFGSIAIKFTASVK